MLAQASSSERFAPFPSAALHPLLDQRWSPCAFSPERVPPEDLRLLFEAARWAPSSHNAQPWRFIIATNDEPVDHERILSCLNDRNRAWARTAPVLMLSFARPTFDLDGGPNLHFQHDLGAAAALMTTQAMSLGLYVHQMGGIDRERIVSLFEIPSEFVPVTAIAVGYLDTSEAGAAVEASSGESRSTERRPLSQTFFTARWGQPHRAVT